MRLEIIQSIQFVIIAFLAYVPMVSIAGWFEAWVSKKCGDDTPEQFGFLTLNPFMHFDLIGFGVLLAGRLLADYLPFLYGMPGWGQFIPVSPSQIDKKRGVLQLHARGIAHFLLALTSIIILAQCMKAGYIGINFKIVDTTSPMLHSFLQVLTLFYGINFVLSYIFLSIGTMRSLIVYVWKDFYVFFAENFFLAMVIGFCTIIALSTIFEYIITSILMLALYATFL